MEPTVKAVEPRTATLLMHCALRPGMAADLTGFVQSHGGRIVYHEQYVDPEISHYYTRLEWDLQGFDVEDSQIAHTLRPLLGDGPECASTLRFSDHVPRMAVFVSKEPWCLHDILARSYSGEWAVAIPVIVSNHPDLQPLAERFGIAFRVFPTTSENKTAVEEAQLSLLAALDVELVVLAKYMQIISGRFVRAFADRVINIHHAFLPAFPGARPYHAARGRGVKMIGATAHYATEMLDAGPIIEQDVVRISHRHSIEDMIRAGRDIEKVVLSRAIRAHLQHKVIVHNGRTIVFH